MIQAFKCIVLCRWLSGAKRFEGMKYPHFLGSSNADHLKIDSDFSPELYSQFETTGHHVEADRYTDIRQRRNLKYIYATQGA